MHAALSLSMCTDYSPRGMNLHSSPLSAQCEAWPHSCPASAGPVSGAALRGGTVSRTGRSPLAECWLRTGDMHGFGRTRTALLRLYSRAKTGEASAAAHKCCAHALRGQLRRRLSAAATATSAAPEEWEVVVGLEVHAQVLSRSKLFSGASASFTDTAKARNGGVEGQGLRISAGDGSFEVRGMPSGAAAGGDASAGGPGGDDSSAAVGGLRANSTVALFDAALPGTLPSLNAAAVDQAIASGLALKGAVQPVSVFERKHYFYCDLPHGYQITQLRHPVVVGGELRVDVPVRDASGRRVAGESRRISVRINRIQLETDSGHNVHTMHAERTFVDLNRAGVALMEIVSEPDLRSADEAGAFLRKLQRLLKHIGACDGKMEEGSMRCDVNVSIRRPGGEFGERVEMKNLNSIRAVVRAVEHETQRQIAQLGDGEAIERETRTFDTATGKTARMRSKEDAMDYRFFPEPDLPPLVISSDDVDRVAASLPQMLDDIEDRLCDPEGPYALSPYDAAVIVGEQGAAEYFEELASGRNGKRAANWLCNELFGRLAAANSTIEASPVSAQQLGGILDMIEDETISGRTGKQVLDELFEAGDGRDPAAVVEERGWAQLSDETALRAICLEIVNDPKSAKMVRQLASGKKNVVKAFRGKVMGATGGRANPTVANKVLDTVLEEAIAEE